MTATRPAVVTPAFAAAITEATLDLADRIRALTGDIARGDQDPVAKLATTYVTALCRRGWRPTNAGPTPDWRSGRRQPPAVARRGAASARALLEARDRGPGEVS
jgi:hypothetical protein